MEENLKKIIMMSDSDSDSGSTEGDSGTATIEEVKVKKPKMFKVLMHNDDYTSMEFVIHTLQKFFQKSYEQSHAVMLKVHHDGIGICGIYTFEVAESKTTKVNKYSRGKGHPLKCTFEPCDSED
jgi:ATP-dependent Clp protease adaptor protein ClpS